MINIVLISVLAGLLTGLFGRLGGMGGKWWQQSWVRDYLIPLVCVIVALIFGVSFGWWITIFLLLTVGALSTYWDWIFGYDNYYVHGFFIGLAAIPIAYVTGGWEFFFYRIIFLTLWMGIWSALIDDVNLEEFGRYFIVGATLFMIC